MCTSILSVSLWVEALTERDTSSSTGAFLSVGRLLFENMHFCSSVSKWYLVFYLFREQTVSVAKNFTYDDGCEPCGTDTFNREPFVVMFSSDSGGV